MKLTAGFKSTEFWLAIVTALALALWPDFPPEALYPVAAYVVSRGLAKFSNGGHK